jgi:hypothetical protein
MSTDPKVVRDLALATPAGWRCPVVRWHRPTPHVRERHHIWPKGDGGPPGGPQAGICGACHNDVHALLELARDNGWELTQAHIRGYAVRVVELAQLGADAINAHMLPVLPAWAAGSAAGG